jgi:hypothetical protein
MIQVNLIKLKDGQKLRLYYGKDILASRRKMMIREITFSS